MGIEKKNIKNIKHANWCKGYLSMHVHAKSENKVGMLSIYLVLFLFIWKKINVCMCVCSEKSVLKLDWIIFLMYL
jgi:hypothetical protein